MKRLVMTIALLCCPSLALTCTETFYLRANGDNSAPKTIAGAFNATGFNTAGNWAATDSVDSKIGPNDCVIVLDDDGVIRATLTAQNSGLNGKPITILGETSLTRIAADDIQSSWTQAIAAEETGGVFSSGIEDEIDAFTTDFTTKTIGGTNTLVTTTTAGEFNHGAKGAKASFAGANANAYASKTLSSSQTTLYLRAFIKLGSAYALQAAFQEGQLLTIWDNTNNRRLADARVQCDATAGFQTFKWLVDANNSGTVLYSGSFGEVPLNTWIRIELKWIQGGVGSGQAEVWIDGVSKGATTTGTWNTFSAEHVRVGDSGIGAAPANGSILYFDDVKADTVAVGAYNPPAGVGYYATQASLPYSAVRDGSLLTNVSLQASLVAGTWWFDSPNGRIYVFDNPSGHTIEIGARTQAFNTGGQSYLVVDGIEMTGAVTKEGIFKFAAGTGNSTIKNCRIHNGYYGVNAAAAVGNNNTVGPGNTIYDLYGFGIVLGNDGTPTGYLITTNLLYNAGTPEGPQLWGADRPSCILTYLNALTVEYNIIHHCHADSLSQAGQHGAYLIGGPSVVRYNTFHDNQQYGVKFSDAAGASAYYNISYANGAGIGLVGSSATIYNNLLYANQIGLHVIAGVGNSTVTSLKNNIIANNVYLGAGDNQIYTAAAQVITTSNNNVIYSSLAPANLCYYQNVAKTWAQWQALGFDAAGVNSDPLLIPVSNYRIQSTSPAKGAGANVGLSTDFSGASVPATPDIGAYQYDWRVVFTAYSNYKETPTGNVVVFDKRH